MRIERISSLKELEKLTDQWNCLTRGVPFRGWQWLLSWARHYCDEGQLFAIAAWQGDALVGLAPLYRSRIPSQGRVLRLLGSGDVCSDYMSLLVTSEHEDAAVSEMARWLCEQSSRAGDDAWDVLELSGIDHHDQVTQKFISQLKHHECRVHVRPGLDCWRIELPSSWEDYVGTLSKSHRKQVRRVERRMLEPGRAVLHTAQDEQELDQGMAILVDLHQRRRSSLGEPGCFACDRFSGFLHEAAQQLLAEGMLQLHWVELDGRSVAAEFHLIAGRTSYAYQAGVDPEAMEDEPGRLINIATLKKAIEDGQRSFDFLRGDEPYKAHWRAQPRPSLEIRVAANRTVSRIRDRAWVAGRTIKSWIKSGLVGARQTSADLSLFGAPKSSK